MAKLLIKLKDPENRNHIRHLKDVMTNQLENDGLKDRFEIWSYMDILDNSQNAEQTLELIFNVIISVTMFICFFSLSSSMSGNLYEQVKEISVMRSIGFTKRIIMKLYIYEAFILVISGSFSGVLIGTCVGWSISVQRSMFVGMPTPLTFPFKEFLFILTVSIIDRKSVV